MSTVLVGVISTLNLQVQEVLYASAADRPRTMASFDQVGFGLGFRVYGLGVQGFRAFGFSGLGFQGFRVSGLLGFRV